MYPDLSVLYVSQCESILGVLRFRRLRKRSGHLKSNDERSHYDVLEVTADATQEDIKRAYRRMAKTHHPDVSGEPGATDRFRRVNEAYRVLGSTQRRFEYDRERLARYEHMNHDREKRARFEQWKRAQAQEDPISRVVSRTRYHIRRLFGL